MSSSTYLRPPPQRRLVGLAIAVVLHLLLLWAVHAGMGQQIVQKMPTVVQAILLQDIQPPTPQPAPQPPPPKPQQPEPQAKPAPPVPPAIPAPMPTPPAQVPPVEVPLAVSPVPTQAIQAAAAVTETPPAAAVSPPQALTRTTPAPTPARAAPPVRKPASVNSAQCDKPKYPSASRRMEEEGTVSLRFLVGVNGQVIQSEIEKSSGFKRLDDAARAGLSLCRFQPATVDGQAEQAWASMKYTWRLE